MEKFLVNKAETFFFEASCISWSEIPALLLGIAINLGQVPGKPTQRASERKTRNNVEISSYFLSSVLKWFWNNSVVKLVFCIFISLSIFFFPLNFSEVFQKGEASKVINLKRLLKSVFPSLKYARTALKEQ